MSAFVYGLGIGFSLILAIGAQNAFVLKQGLKQQYVFWVCFICALSDSILIYFGVTGFSKVIANFPLLLTVSKYFGAAFLFLYGLRNFYSAIKNSSSLNPSDIEKDSLLKIIGICLAFTWLNPHVYLDAIILIGSISVQFSDQLYQFAAGTILASWIFFFSVGYGAKMLLPLFKRATSWKILDVLIGITMWAIATMLII
ncbi:LysE/ArgO family amino acid transporter [Acinetobacter venetianus]|jgi:L-lysine exporter family protein LysE/ArgO|uniref:LysE/ArgO family amino acid transporter n=1 Tax=Acinetobacter venetianus TaxID=52133 RepID=UPI0010A5D574|nr:LysE/ArgO family amino acid transporter [Acinetobacter venetianus]MCR4531654.1 LysE/ArgO family amino acid transporter [Acinetobacter venetianus]MDA0697942.1 LysE/ArgO family amino acid transporter [Pseudomonadota bacterium]MDA1254529.1 LysE/ArgO family amino acid transporter [Pseudomonadota bacterium]